MIVFGTPSQEDVIRRCIVIILNNDLPGALVSGTPTTLATLRVDSRDE